MKRGEIGPHFLWPLCCSFIIPWTFYSMWTQLPMFTLPSQVTSMFSLVQLRLKRKRLKIWYENGNAENTFCKFIFGNAGHALCLLLLFQNHCKTLFYITVIHSYSFRLASFHTLQAVILLHKTFSSKQSFKSPVFFLTFAQHPMAPMLSSSSSRWKFQLIWHSFLNLFVLSGNP